MSLARVQGQTRAVEALQAVLRRGTVPHAWLFEGPEGVGKELAAFAFAQALVCPEKPLEGCDACAACKRVLKGMHPDVTRVLPEDEQVRRGWAGRSDFDHTPSRDIRVEQVRALQERLAFRALESKWKVAVLLTAHAMNPQAQNALLKTLEEPPRDTVLVLVSSASDKLLPTIRSRCTRALFGPLPENVIAAHLQTARKLDAAKAAPLARLAQGSLSRAMELDEKVLTERRDIIERFEALDPKDARGWLAFAEVAAEDRAQAELSLEVLREWLHLVARAQAGASVEPEFAALATASAAKQSAATLHRRALLIDEARNAITSRNGGLRLQLERMLIEMHA
ncbi:MAG: DNA polymerase III subunit delta' [Myxococcaceae bacterium]|nr:DNA polymerase III subunit delta' [Myxococcaceae bacterium]